MRVLVGCDGCGTSARDALALAALLARASEIEVVLGVVLPGIDPWEDFHSHEEILGAGSTQTFAWAEAYLRELDPDLTTERRAIGGQSPADGLRDMARREGAELIVIGSTHRGPLGRLVPGTTADGLLADASCPLAVAPRGYAESADRELRLVGVAYDGSREAQRAARVTQGLAAGACTGLRAFGVIEPLVGRTLPGMPVPLDDRLLRERLEKDLDALLAELPPGIGGQKLILAGEPAETLLEQGRRAADVMVFGTHGFGRVLRLLAGSVASKVVRAAPWPVIVVPPKGPLPFTPASRREPSATTTTIGG